MITIKLKKNFLPLFFVLLCAFCIFKMPYAVTGGITDGLKICFYTVLPSLFPFTVLSSYISRTDALLPVYRFLSPVTKYVFRQPPAAAPVIVMSLIGGFPIGAKMTAELYCDGRLTENQAQRLNMFCMNAGPAFTVTAVGVSMLSSRRAGAVIFASLCASSLIIGFLTSFLDDKSGFTEYKSRGVMNPLSALSASVTDAVNTMLSICAWIIMFSAVTGCFEASCADSGLLLAVCSLTEVTDGCRRACGVLPLPAITAIIGFGGLCVHCQVYQFIAKTGIKYRLFFAFRAINAAVAALISHILFTLFPVEVSTLSAPAFDTAPFSASLPAFLALASMCVIMIFDVDTKKKLW